MPLPQTTNGATTAYGFFATVLLGLAFGIGFFVASNVLAWVASLLSH